MKGNTKAMALSMTAIFALSILAIGAMAGKPAPSPPPYVEPLGNLVMTSGLQPVLGMSNGYVRVYDWVNGKFSHTWSGLTKMPTLSVAIGDVDNDGKKEVVTSGSDWTVIKVKGVQQQVLNGRALSVWKDGDASGSPSFSYDPGFSAGMMAIGDVDNDGSNELVMSGGRIWSWNGSGFTEEAKIANFGSEEITIADADNDGYNELIVGMDKNKGHATVYKYSSDTGTYSVVGDLGPANTNCAIDEVSVGDLDGDGKNELFGSGYCNGNIYVWKYSNGAYNQVWTAQETSTEFHQNNVIADVNGDSKNEFAFTTLNAQTLVVYKYAGNNVWSKLGTYANCGNHGVGMMPSGDFDSDGAKELLVEGAVWDWNGSAMKDVQDLAVPYDTALA